MWIFSLTSKKLCMSYLHLLKVSYLFIDSISVSWWIFHWSKFCQKTNLKKCNSLILVVWVLNSFSILLFWKLDVGRKILNYMWLVTLNFVCSSQNYYFVFFNPTVSIKTCSFENFGSAIFTIFEALFANFKIAIFFSGNILLPWGSQRS